MNAARTTFGTRMDNDTATLTVSGDTAARDRIAPLGKAVTDLLQRGARTVVVDLSTARLVGAAVLGELVAAQQAVTRAGGRMRLAGITRKAARALVAARLEAVLKVVELRKA